MLASKLQKLILASALAFVVPWWMAGVPVIGLAYVIFHPSLTGPFLAVVAVVLGLSVLILVCPVIRFVTLPAGARRHYLPALWYRWRWTWLCRNLGLAYLDKHTRMLRPGMTRTAVVVKRRHGEGEHGQARILRTPRARFKPDPFGIVATVRTVPGSGRAEFEAAAEHIANSWHCHRVQIHQPRPGRLIVRGLREDPLAVPYASADAPQRVAEAWQLHLGRDEWGTDRHAQLAGLTGISVAGLPGYGKTQLISSWLCELAPDPAVQLVLVDGKDGGDYSAWEDRAWLHCGDRLADAAGVLEDCHSLMRSRLNAVLERTGHRNAWHIGPTPDFPLVVIVIDEAHTYFDTDAVKGDRQAEAHVRTCRALVGQLVRKGRSVLMLTVLATQKPTADSIPTAIRDNSGLSLSFAVKTRDAAVAALGDQIREYPSYCPTTLQDPAYVGVATARLRTGHDPYVRLRVPEITEAEACRRAAETANARHDPTLPVSIPGELVPA